MFDLASEKPATGFKLLIVEDSIGDAILLRRALNSSAGILYEIMHVRLLKDAVELLLKETFDIVLLDRSLPDADGFEGFNNIQNLAPNLPIIFLTGYEDEQTALAAIRMGAQDYLYKGNFADRDVKRAVCHAIERKAFESKLIERANFDILANRRMFDNYITIALSRKKRQQNSLALFFLDLNGFKAVNDQYGHLTGDRLLIEIAKRIKGSLRSHDIAGRLGGDEFGILVENYKDARQCSVIAQKIVNSCEKPIVINGEHLCVGISIGISVSMSEQEDSVESLLSRADSAMYEAKSKKQSGYCFARSAIKS